MSNRAHSGGFSINGKVAVAWSCDGQDPRKATEPNELKWEDNDQAHLVTGREDGRATLALAEPGQRLT